MRPSVPRVQLTAQGPPARDLDAPGRSAFRDRRPGPDGARDLTDPVRLEPEARLRRFFDEVSLLVVALDIDGRILYLNRALATQTESDPALVVGMPWLATFIPASERAALEASFREPAYDESFGEGRFTSGLLTRNGVRNVRWTTAPFRDVAGKVIGSIALGVDATERLAATAARERLQVAVEATADSVVVTDPDGTITYVNPAFERVSGWPREAAVGANPRILASGQQSRAFYAAMWATLTSGRTWHGELVNKRRDGTLFTEEATITPVFSGDGTLLHYVGVKRDVTAARALQSRLDESSVDQASMAAMVADLVLGDSPETGAEAICDRVLTLPGVAFAAIALFRSEDRLESLAAIGLDRVQIPPVDPGSHWPGPMRRRARRLFQLASAGPSIEVRSESLETPMAEAYARLAITALAVAPVLSQGQPIGFLQIGTADIDGDASLRPLLPTLGAFGALASVLLGPQLGARARSEERRGAVRRVLEHQAFRPVFQPIVSLATGDTVGFEALTRFTDGTPPDEHFAAAASSGLGLDLEFATLEVAIAASTALPRDAWLDVNISPALLEDPARLAYLLWKAGARSVVLEMTEHEAIADYQHLRGQIDLLGIPVRLAVDDAGAGFASLRHILELRPDIIKLDRSLIIDIDHDPVRQGLVAGLRQFGSTAGALVIAEGVETPAEYATLMDLGIELGQGYLLGRPGPVGTVRTHRFKPLERRTRLVRPGDPAAQPTPRGAPFTA
jgi:PAS domain S-box-containing protein